MGVEDVSGVARADAKKSNPFIPGICMSTMIALNGLLPVDVTANCVKAD